MPRRKPERSDDPLDNEIKDVNKLIITSGETYGIYVTGEPMEDDDIYPGDLLIVDRTLTPKVGDVIVEDCDDGLTITHYRSRLRLASEDDDPTAEVWGVVTFSIRAVRKAVS